MKNIVLIGMPGAGKSTIGVLLAKALMKNFVDTDLVIQEREGKFLHDIIRDYGIEEFLRTEERVVLSLNCSDTVIATGGSVVLSDRAMSHLKKTGPAIYLKVPYGEIVKRLNNISTRGIVMAEGETLLEMYRRRLPLYEKYSDITVDCSGKDMEKIVLEIVSATNL